MFIRPPLAHQLTLFASNIGFTIAIAQSTSQCNGLHVVVAEEILCFTDFNKQLKDLGV